MCAYYGKYSSSFSRFDDIEELCEVSKIQFIDGLVRYGLDMVLAFKTLTRILQLIKGPNLHQ